MKKIILLGLVGLLLRGEGALLPGNKNRWPYIAEESSEGLFIQAVTKADIPTIKHFIKMGLSVDITHGGEMFHMGYPLLSYAIKSQSIETVKLLIDAKADVNSMVEHGIRCTRKNADMRNMPLLSYAITLHSPIEILRALIDAGADINKKGFVGGWTPLMIASYCEYDEAVTLLLEKGADPLIQNTYDQNRTALDYAKEKNKFAIIEQVGG